MEVDRAENQLLELIRGDGRDFTLTVSVKADHWIVNITDPNGSSHFSSGEAFEFRRSLAPPRRVVGVSVRCKRLASVRCRFAPLRMSNSRCQTEAAPNPWPRPRR